MNSCKIQVQRCWRLNFCKGYQKEYFILKKDRIQKGASASVPFLLVCLSLSKEVEFKNQVYCKQYCIFNLHFHSLVFNWWTRVRCPFLRHKIVYCSFFYLAATLCTVVYAILRYLWSLVAASRCLGVVYTWWKSPKVVMNNGPLTMKSIDLWNNWGGRRPQESLVQPPAQSRVSCGAAQVAQGFIHLGF